MHKIYFILIVLLAFVIVGCPRRDAAKPTDPIIKIGTTVITERDVDIKNSIEACYRDDKKTPEKYLGLYQLIEEALMEESAKTLNIFVTPDILMQESQRVDKETKAPDILAAVKGVCADEGFYQNIYLKPRLINRVLHYQFADDKTIQEVPYDKAKDALIIAKDGKPLKDLEGYSVQEIDPNKPKTPNAPMPNPASPVPLNMGDPEKELIDTVLDKLAPGQVYPEIREDRYGFYIIKLLEHKDKYYKYEMVTCKKKDFDRWFNETVYNIKKEIYRRDLIDQIIKNTPGGTVNKYLKENN